MATYFSYAQACAICKQYQYLVGRPFNTRARIDAVVVAPYNSVLQANVLQDHVWGLPCPEDYFPADSNGQYDVLAITLTTDARGYRAKDIRMMLAELDMRFSPERYASHPQLQTAAYSAGNYLTGTTL